MSSIFWHGTQGTDKLIIWLIIPWQNTVRWKKDMENNFLMRPFQWKKSKLVSNSLLVEKLFVLIYVTSLISLLGFNDIKRLIWIQVPPSMMCLLNHYPPDLRDSLSFAFILRLPFCGLFKHLLDMTLPTLKKIKRTRKKAALFHARPRSYFYYKVNTSDHRIVKMPLLLRVSLFSYITLDSLWNSKLLDLERRRA